MPRRNWNLRIEDILDSVDAIGAFVKDMSFENCSQDRRTVGSVVRHLVVGEAARYLPEPDPSVASEFGSDWG